MLNSPGLVNTTCTIPGLLTAAPDSVTAGLIQSHTQVDARGGCLGGPRIRAALR
jgi:hypothetical protein